MISAPTVQFLCVFASRTTRYGIVYAPSLAAIPSCKESARPALMNRVVEDDGAPAGFHLDAAWVLVEMSLSSNVPRPPPRRCGSFRRRGIHPACRCFKPIGLGLLGCARLVRLLAASLSSVGPLPRTLRVSRAQATSLRAEPNLLASLALAKAKKAVVT